MAPAEKDYIVFMHPKALFKNHATYGDMIFLYAYFLSFGLGFTLRYSLWLFTLFVWHSG